tara:strand:- start:7379 stop:11026 length:3648 start_codon:yes stop_codon:yes gene_type:complete
MADRFPLIVNSVSKKIEELVSGDNLDLSGNGIIVNGDTGSGKYLSSDGTVVFWDNPGDVYLTQTQTLTNKTLEQTILDGSVNSLSNIPNSALSNSSISINGTPIALGGSVVTPDNNTTYSIGAADGQSASQKNIVLTDSGAATTSVVLGVSSPSSLPAGSNALTLFVDRTGDNITLSGHVVDNDTVTTLQSFTGGTAQSGAMIIKGSGGATISQDAASKTINIDTRNDDTVTTLKTTGVAAQSGNFTFLEGTTVTLNQSTDGNGDPTIEINSTDTITRLKGGATGAFVSGDVTISGGSALGGNVAVSQTGNTIEIDSTDTDTITQIASGVQSMASGNFRFKQAGATTITQTTLQNGEIEIEIESLNTDSGASFGAGTGLTFNNNQFSIKNSNNLIDNRIPVWDNANGQFANGSITDDGSSVTVDGDLIVKGNQTILETSTLVVEDNAIELRKGNNLTGADGGVQVNRTTDATGAVLSFNRIEWYEPGTYWRSYDGSVAKRFVTEDDTQTLTNKTLTSPIMTNPTLGGATATTYNGLAIAATSASTLDMADLKTLTINSSVTFNAADAGGAVNVNFDNGGGSGAKVAYSTYHLGQFALTSSTQLSGKIQDKSGSGKLMFDTNPVIVDSILTSSNAFDLINTSALDIDFGGDATIIKIGASTGTTEINHALDVALDTTLGAASTAQLQVNASANFDNHDITIRGTDAVPITVGRGGSAVSTNTAFGYSVLGGNQSGSQNTAIGYQTLLGNNAGAANTGLGYRALRDNDGGNNNIGIGKDALLINTSGSGNIAIGVSTLENNPGSGYNVCIGHFAGHAATGIGNVIIGPASTEDSLSTTYVPPNASGDRQLVIGSGTGAWIRGDSNFNVTTPNDLTVDGDARILGDLRVDGSVVNINSTTLTIDDKNIELAAVVNLTITATVNNGNTTISDINPISGIIEGMQISSAGGAVPAGTTIVSLNPATKTAVLSNAVSSSNAQETFVVSGPTDTAADGGGLILKGTPVSLGGVGDKSFLYDHSRTKKYFVSTENLELANGKEFAIGNQLVLSGTTLGDGVVNSSLTSVGVLVGATGQPALETDGAAVLGGRVIEKVFSNMTTGFSLSSNTLTVVSAAANTICGETTTANQAINVWAFNTADPDGTTLANGQSLTLTLIIDSSTASTYGDDCTVDGNNIPTGVRWSGGSPPIATSNTDILTFLIVKDAAGVTRVYGQGNTDFS